MTELVYLINTPPSWIKTPPLSLAYLKAYLKKHRVKTQTVDLNLQLFTLVSPSLPQWLKLNQNFEENLFNFAENKFPSFFENLYDSLKPATHIGFSVLRRNSAFAFSMAEKIRQKFPQKKIIFGGPQTLFLEKQGSLNELDYWVIGEGETALCSIINGEKQKCYRFNELANLDELPLYDFGQPKARNCYSPLPLLSSRGCPYRCSFCTERLLYKKFRCHSPQYILEQITYLKKKYSRENFVFLDSLINYSRKWLFDFCSLLLKSNLGIKWEAQMRIENNFPPELAELIKKSGCYNLFIGLESGSDKVLELMNKGFNTSTATNFFKVLKKVGLHFEISLIFGYPGEKEEDFKATLNFIQKNKYLIPKIAQANPFLDYMNSFPKQKYSTPAAEKRVDKFIEVMEEEKIRYTKSFIGNLQYNKLS